MELKAEQTAREIEQVSYVNDIRQVFKSGFSWCGFT